MAIRFQCPNCDSIRSANERLAGRQIKCPDCGVQVTVPTLEELEQQQLAEERAAQEQHQRALEQAAANVVEAVDVPQLEVKTVDEKRIEREEKALSAAMTSFTRPRSPESKDMDMTPMVDVTFLLLIFFMITASFSVQKSVQRPAHKKDDPSVNTIQLEDEDNPDIVTVQVDEFNAYNVITTDWDRVVGSKQDLIVALGDAHTGGSVGRAPTKLIVQAHEDCIHASVIAALDAGREAQFESFEVSTVEFFD